MSTHYVKFGRTRLFKGSMKDTIGESTGLEFRIEVLSVTK